MKTIENLRGYILTTHIGSILIWVAFAGALASAIQAASVAEWHVAFWAGMSAGWVVLFRAGHAVIAAQHEVMAAQQKVVEMKDEHIRELLTMLANIDRRSNGDKT